MIRKYDAIQRSKKLNPSHSNHLQNILTRIVVVVVVVVVVDTKQKFLNCGSGIILLCEVRLVFLFEISR